MHTHNPDGCRSSSPGSSETNFSVDKSDDSDDLSMGDQLCWFLMMKYGAYELAHIFPLSLLYCFSSI